MLVSIHAPARGATIAVTSLQILLVSIHAPARGATLPRHEQSQGNGFNPRARAGCDRLRNASSRWCRFQSTRPRGVRPSVSISFAARSVSIHAPARGATHIQSPIILILQFQSTRPRGVRHKKLKVVRADPVSIHAPARGATF